jgi:MbtH protein
MMADDGDRDATVYVVVVNRNEQYSIWPADRPCPSGWRATGRVGSKEECLAYVEEVWRDMRPFPPRGAPGRAGGPEVSD